MISYLRVKLAFFHKWTYNVHHVGKTKRISLIDWSAVRGAIEHRFATLGYVSELFSYW